MTFTVIFAYNSTESIPSAGDQRKSFDVSLADDSKSTIVGERHELIDYSGRRDVVGKRLRLLFKIGPAVLSNADNRAWFQAFFDAQHRWAVYGNFKDAANSGDDYLCKCEPTEDDVQVHVKADLDNGFELLSELVF